MIGNLLYIVICFNRGVAQLRNDNV